MSIRRVPFRTILEGVLAPVGQTLDTALTAQLTIAVNAINMRVEEGWNYGAWPEWTLCQERPFADKWYDDLSYAAGDLVYYAPNHKYYTALLAGTNQNPVTATTYWEETVDVDQIVGWEQYYQDKIGRVLGVTNADPNTTLDYYDWEWELGADGLLIPEATGDTVWVKFLKRPPRFSASIWTAAPATAYQRYDVVFYPGTESGNFPSKGECYELDLDTDSNPIYTLVEFPAVLEAFVTRAAAADLARFYGQEKKADVLEDRAYKSLNDAAGLWIPQKRVHVKMSF